MSDPTADRPSIIDRRPDGTVRLRLGEQTVRLRRPTVAQLWAVQDAVTDTIDEWSDVDAQHAEKVEALCAEHGIDVPEVREGPWWVDLSRTTQDREARKALRDANRKHTRKVMGLWFQVGRDMVEALSKDVLPEADDDLDPALGSQALYVALLSHWQTVPLVSGGTPQ